MMNDIIQTESVTKSNQWYRIAKDLSKIAQIWKYQPDEEDYEEWGDLQETKSNIKQFYEMEYKLSMIRNKPFSGHPDRKENIEKQIKTALTEAAENLQEILIDVLGKWLAQHAILNPERWAEERVQSEIDEGVVSIVNNLLSEYNRYVGRESLAKQRQNPYSDYSGLLSEILDKAIKNLNKHPYLEDFLTDIVLPDQKEWLMQEARDDLGYFNDLYNKSFETFEEAEKWIDENMSIDEMLLEPEIIAPDIESFVSALSQTGYFDEVITELYQNHVFPAWYAYWSQQGIDETRETIENIYNGLKNANSADLGNLCSWVSMALNASHQNGSMLEYLEEMSGEQNLRDAMDKIEQGGYVDKANKELKSIGVQI